ncbi:dihydrolipoamide dehydrogenase [Nocardia amikacinitolerans]|uniref:Dihydrolipoamide dehydrogenase n=1 Tax=Nocardia amikacinitolerans TaxID=756689 RepID=A0A285L867_9NOCA|nr:NAD(P)/FAD-dependent oxidoreductase [Nocardia amikacinitolerans]SNY81072.1 dihydrolipoamide dehydrogenase [Nocardia amikacinitolerans]
MSSEPSAEYDVIVIGGGPAGENAAAYAIADSDRTAAIVERELLGGECSYWACMPSKALLRPGHLLAAARAVPGIDANGLDAEAVLARRDRIVHDHDDSGQVEWAESSRIEVIRGAGRLAGERLVEVDGRTLRARHAVVLASGSRARVPDVPGLRDALPWTSRDATNLHEIPQRVVLIGGGVVACEAATWLAALGSEVTLLVRGKALLTNTEPFAGQRVADALAASGVRVLFETEPERVTRSEPKDTGEGRIHGGPVTVRTRGAHSETIEADEIVVAAGRGPATAELGLSSVGLTDGYVEVDDHLSARDVPGQWLYAVGDVNHRAALTHMGKYQARVCGDVIAARAEGRPLAGARYAATADHEQVPQVVFTDPEVAAVGLTEAAARRAGYDVDSVEIDIAVAGSTLARENYSGRAKIVIDTASDTLLGATFVGPEVGELLHAATIAVVGKIPLDTLWHAVPAYPTVSEIWLRLLEARRS